MTYKQFEEKFYQEVLPKKHSDCRKGQSLMNFLCDVWYMEYRRINNILDIDCFYNDKHITNTLEHLKNNWHRFYEDIKKVYYTVSDDATEDENFTYLTGQRTVIAYYINNGEIIPLLSLDISITDNSEEKLKEELNSIGFSKNICLVNL